MQTDSCYAISPAGQTAPPAAPTPTPGTSPVPVSTPVPAIVVDAKPVQTVVDQLAQSATTWKVVSFGLAALSVWLGYSVWSQKKLARQALADLTGARSQLASTKADLQKRQDALAAIRHLAG